eukprot:evm.model.scf_229.13 EVM.evm.TU.scf_229.13   scf_229:112858-115029(+)
MVITGMAGGAGGAPVIDWRIEGEVFVVAPNAMVTFQNLIVVQDTIPADRFDLTWLNTQRMGSTTMFGVVVGVRTCRAGITTYSEIFTRAVRPPYLPGEQVASEVGPSALLLIDLATELPDGGRARICNSALQCNVSADDAILRDLLEDDKTNNQCSAPVTPPPPTAVSGDSGDVNILVVIAVSVFGAMLMLCIATTVVIVWLRRRMLPPIFGPDDPSKSSSGTNSVERLYTDEDGKPVLAPPGRFGGNHWNLQLSEVQIGTQLGKGGFGRVYKGSWQGTTVAVKIIRHNDRTLQTNVGEPFEAFLSKHISHPNVVQTFHISTREISSADAVSPAAFFDTGSRPAEDPPGGHARNSSGSEELFGSFGGGQSFEQASAGSRFETWIVLEYCDRGSLAKAIADGFFQLRGPVKAYRVTHALRTALEVAHAMNYLHSVRIIHGDLKPGNVLLKGDNSDPRGFTCKVGDFGLSRFLAEESHIQTFTCGTVTHMPPELLKGGVLTPAADVYSFGVLMWELMSGHRPYPGKTQREIVLAVVDGERPAITDEFIPEYAAMLHACWDADYARRPSFPALIERLREMLDKHGRRRGPSNPPRGSEESVTAATAGSAAIERVSGAVSREDAMSVFYGDGTPLAHGIKRQLTPPRIRSVEGGDREEVPPTPLLDSIGSDIGNSGRGRLYSSVGMGAQFAAEPSSRHSMGGNRRQSAGVEEDRRESRLRGDAARHT